MNSFFIAIALSLLFFIPNVTFANASQAGQQISVMPSITRLDLATDQPQAELFYKNTSSQTIELTFEAQNFTVLEDRYTLSFLDPKDAQNYQYGLSSWIHFSNTSLILDPGETNSIKIFIDNNRLTPGGHYATILAHINEQKEKGTQQVHVQGTLGSLLFVRTNTGKEYEHANLLEFDLQRDIIDFPNTFYFRFNNTGDTDLTPYGLLQLYNASHILIAKGIINEASAPTLPQSIRRYYVLPKTLGQFLWPGMYIATISLHFGKPQQTITKTILFFSQGSLPLIPITVALVLLGGLGIKYLLKHFQRRNNS